MSLIIYSLSLQRLSLTMFSISKIQVALKIIAQLLSFKFPFALFCCIIGYFIIGIIHFDSLITQVDLVDYIECFLIVYQVLSICCLELMLGFECAGLLYLFLLQITDG